MGAESSLCVALLRPRVGEIQIDPVNFAAREIFSNNFRLSADKAEIGKLQFVLPLYAAQQNA